MAKIKFPDKHLSEIREFYEEELGKAKRRLKHIKNVLAEIAGTNTPSKSSATASSKPAARRGRPPKKKTAVASTTPKRRGRPPKKATETTTAAPKRRGRPPKKQTETVVAAPKRRGRPPKKKTETVTAAPKRRGRPPKKSTAAKTPAKSTAVKGKAGRKSVWDKIIVERLTALNKPVTYEELTDDVMKAQKLPAAKRASTKQAVVNVIFRMRNRNDHVDTVSLGSREKFVVLKTWCSSPGKLNATYAAKVSTDSKPAPKAAAKKSTATKKKAAPAKKTGRKRGRPRKNA